MGILIASNVVKLMATVTKLDASDLVFIIPSSATVSSQLNQVPVPLPTESIDQRSYQVELIRNVFEKLFACRENACVLNLKNDKLIIPTIRALAVLGSELSRHTPIVGEQASSIWVDIQPNGETVRMIVGLGKEISIIEKIVDLVDPCDSIHLQVESSVCTLLDLTNTVLRIFMAGFVDIMFKPLVGQDDGKVLFLTETHFSEMILIVSKYFSLSLSREGEGILIGRKSKTVDPGISDRPAQQILQRQ
jgi:hypothetical protein